MPIFSLIGCTLTELFSKPANWRQIYKQTSSTFHTSNEAMYNTRNTGKGNGMRGTQGMWGMLYSGKCCQTFRGMSSNILGNSTKPSGECRQIFRGMISSIPGNVTKTSGECRQMFRGMLPIFGVKEDNYLAESHFQSYQTSTMELFCENIQRL